MRIFASGWQCAECRCRATERNEIMTAKRHYEVITLNMGAYEWCCRELEKQAAGFAPDLVVAIARGGIGVAYRMFEGVRHAVIDVHRPSTGAKRRLRPLVRLVRWLPLWLRDGLRIAEARRLDRRPPRAVVPPEENARALREAAAGAQRILVVDDAVDSGASLRAVLDILEGCGAQVRTASVAFTRLNQVACPHYHIFEPGTLVRFPGSIDARRERPLYKKRRWWR